MLANTYMALTKTGDIAVADEDAGTGHGIKEFNNFFLHVLAL